MADGKEGLVVGGTPEAATPVCIQPGIPHTFWNARNTTELDLGEAVVLLQQRLDKHLRSLYTVWLSRD